MSPKEVRWKLTVDEYAAQQASPEGRTSPLPSPDSDPDPNPNYTPPPSPPWQWLPQTPRRPPRPLPLPTPAPAPAPLELHPALRPSSPLPLPLDLSLPSAFFRRTPHLPPALLAAPACTPPRADVCIRVAAGLYKAKLAVQHVDAPGEPVTVGDVLTAVQGALRQRDHGTGPPEARAYMRRRIETVRGYCARPNAADAAEDSANAAIEAAEEEEGGRMVDHLLGHTLFAGLTIQLGQPDHCWQLALTIPPRYEC